MKEHGILFEDIDITSTPPAKQTLRDILRSSDYLIKQLFNTSGQLYRSMNMKDKIASTTESDLIDLLSKNGKLVKRPVITDGKRHTVGFREEAFRQTWL